MKKKIYIVVGLLLLIIISVFWISIHNSTKTQSSHKKNHTSIKTESKEISQPTQKSQTITTPNPTPVCLFFAGDMMFDRSIRINAQKKQNYEYILQDLTQTLSQADLVIANLEGPITNYYSLSTYTNSNEKNHFIFTFDPTITKTLKKNKINLVNIGNNHILNFGNKGLEQTTEFLQKAGINYFGQINSNYNENRVFFTKIHNIQLAFLNYNQFAYNLETEDIVLKDIKKANKTADIVIVYAHWGNEYQLKPSQNQIKLAHNMINQGADLIIGSHPHVVQTNEIYNDRYIYYSLGNFIFDQYFNKQVKNGLLLKVLINPETYNLKIKEIPIKLDLNGSTKLGSY